MPSVLVAERRTVLAMGLQAIFARIGCESNVRCNSASAFLDAFRTVPPDLIYLSEDLQTECLHVWQHSKSVDTVGIIAARNLLGSSEHSLLMTHSIVGLLHVDAEEAQYRQCVRALLEQSSWIDPHLLSTFRVEASAAGESGLTSRESQVVGMVRRGMRNKQIAKELGLTEGTVKMHLHHVYSKLGLCTRVQLAMASAAATVPQSPPELAATNGLSRDLL